MRVTVLLGAGASVPAGISTARRMAEEVLEKDGLVERSYQTEFRGLLQFIRSILEAHDTSNAREPAMDIERLGDAVNSLANRYSSPLIAFIGAWHAELEVLESALENECLDGEEWVAQLKRAVESGRPFEQRTPYGIDALAQRAPARFPYNALQGRLHRLQTNLVGAVCKLTRIDSTTDLRYLYPLLDFHRTKHRLTIATLNYDNAIELAASNASVPIDTGLASFNDYHLSFDVSALRLLKLHGSANWVEVVVSASSTGGTIYSYQDEIEWENSGVGLGIADSADPAVIFGGTNKLRAEGPYLDLLGAWRDELSRSERLVVVGYSFRDRHINAIIHKWQRDPSRKRPQMVICDPDAHDIRLDVQGSITPYGNAAFALEGGAGALRIALFATMEELQEVDKRWPGF